MATGRKAGIDHVYLMVDGETDRELPIIQSLLSCILFTILLLPIILLSFIKISDRVASKYQKLCFVSQNLLIY